MPVEWTEWPGYRGDSWNPISGCTPVSEACERCWAKAVSRRFGWNPEFKVMPHYEKFDNPLHWRRPRAVFVVDMGDLFHELVPDADIHRIFETIRRSSRHLFFICTKRPKRMIDFLAFHYTVTDFNSTFPHVWWGVTAENQQRLNERLPLLLQVPSKNRYISAEPLLGPLEIGPIGMLKWIIVGGESGRGCRPMDLDWARNIRDQCAEAGVAYYFKQIGGFPDPKHRNKALLDGKLYKEFPLVRFQCNSIQKEALACIHCDHARPHFRTNDCTDGVARCSFLPFSSCKQVV